MAKATKASPKHKNTDTGGGSPPRGKRIKEIFKSPVATASKFKYKKHLCSTCQKWLKGGKANYLRHIQYVAPPSTPGLLPL